MSHLLDSNSWIHYMRKGAASKVTARLNAAPPGSIYLCSVVLGELIFGALHGKVQYRALNMASVTKLRNDFISLPFHDPAAEEYASIREHLTVRGMLIGTNDMMIASIARANHLILVTNNTREFSRIPGLILEDWQ